jgi:3-methyladenine DNA glycosylase/8-oxoguanine DNA glycosylase
VRTVQHAGRAVPRRRAAFPTPERIAALPFDDLHAQVRAGYRDAYLHELARRIAAGDIEVESWRGLPSDALYKRITSLKGFGDYAAGNMLKLLGHYDRLATDTVCRDVYKNQLNNGIAAANDAEIAAYYEPFGHWRGLVQWMDVAANWLRRPS